MVSILIDLFFLSYYSLVSYFVFMEVYEVYLSHEQIKFSV